ncbi:MAG: hypothetical protein JSW00_13230 [Thermoplasmata archaeon]|nr:MAG: hypothetical protein JSW00_13230 [Thermoplasmata archaeon]
MERKKKEKRGSIPELLDGCDCINCRVGRIENRLNHIQTILESAVSQNSREGKKS